MAKKTQKSVTVACALAAISDSNPTIAVLTITPADSNDLGDMVTAFKGEKIVQDVEIVDAENIKVRLYDNSLEKFGEEGEKDLMKTYRFKKQAINAIGRGTLGQAINWG